MLELCGPQPSAAQQLETDESIHTSAYTVPRTRCTRISARQKTAQEGWPQTLKPDTDPRTFEQTRICVDGTGRGERDVPMLKWVVADQIDREIPRSRP